MIQRIQTIFYLLGLVCLGMMNLFDLALWNEVVWTIEGLSGLEEGATAAPLLNTPLKGIVIGLMALIAFAIFSYKNQKRQIMLGRISFLLILGLIVFIYLSIEQISEGLGADISSVVYGYSTYLPLGALAMVMLGNRGVKRDLALVQAMDRLR